VPGVRPTRNYFVAIDGKLIAIGYNTFTKRVVTALPDHYVAKLPPGLVHFARFRLLNDETGVISDILNRRYSRLLYRQDESVSYCILQYPGFSFKTGYNCQVNRLVPFVTERLEIRRQIRQKVRSRESRLIWRYSDSVKFHEEEPHARRIPCRLD
jgi:hypothetical protein